MYVRSTGNGKSIQLNEGLECRAAGGHFAACDRNPLQHPIYNYPSDQCRLVLHWQLPRADSIRLPAMQQTVRERLYLQDVEAGLIPPRPPLTVVAFHTQRLNSLANLKNLAQQAELGPKERRILLKRIDRGLKQQKRGLRRATKSKITSIHRSGRNHGNVDGLCRLPVSYPLVGHAGAFKHVVVV